MSVNKIHEFFNRDPENWNILTFLEECDIPLFKQKIESYLTSLEVISNTQKGPKRERANKLLDQYRQAIFETSYEAVLRRKISSFLRLRLRVNLALAPLGGPDYVCARDWKKERRAKPVDGTEVHIHQVTNSSVIGINNGSFNVSRRPKKSTRKRKTICYLESSEEDHLSDQDYTEEPKKNKKSRSTRSRRKAERDSMDKDDIINESSEDENISEDVTLVEISPSTIQAQPIVTVLNNSEDTWCKIALSTPQQTSTSFDISATSRESTPCPISQLAQQVLINTPNKPIVTKVMCDKYSPYLVCAFSATIDYVKETVEVETYREIEKLFLMKNRLVLQESFVKKLESIFETEYSKIESKIIDLTIVEGDNQTEVAGFNFFVRYALLDFIANFKYRSPKVLDRNMSERTFIVECLAPIFRAFRNAFPDIKYDWIEKNVTSIREANNMFVDAISPRKTDLLVVRLSDGMEILNTEVSGPPFKATITHTVGDAKKLLMMSICSLCRIFGDNLDCSVNDAKRIKTYSIQVVGDRLTLFSVSITDQKKYLAVEIASCIIPFSFDSISYYTKIFNFFAIIQDEFKEQEKLRKKIHSSIPIVNNEKIRDWLYLPKDSFFYDLKPIPEDIDEILMI
ncbi:10088_t:CDS:2 [Cetraspora pellucida]|uniref:10088_t:CDS:1 n=1 Tax=Cetraspora pellucida TaxID=1433469 RepID=A0A9N9HW05_9GLOM|nr:10088_t:CDS:2 [Cetraspora pellucida]